MITNMKRSFLFFLRFCCLLVLFLCLAAPIRSRAFEVTEKSGLVEATTGVYVRSGPGKEYDSLGSLKEGDQLPVTGLTESGWYQVKFRGEEGYVYSSYVAELSMGAPAEVKESEDSEAKTDASTAETTVSETEETQAGLTLPIVNITVPWLTRTLLYVLAAIVIILIVIISTLLSFRRDGDDDEEDDEDYE
nr:SH3 domain-containing protein [Lachnospiraceae bacterium]